MEHEKNTPEQVKFGNEVKAIAQKYKLIHDFLLISATNEDRSLFDQKVEKSLKVRITVPPSRGKDAPPGILTGNLEEIACALFNIINKNLES